MRVQVKLPDGKILELEQSATGADAALAIGEGLARAALAIKVDGEIRDLSRQLIDGAVVEIITSRSPEALELIRHDTAHVLAAAVLELYPGTKISIGPPIEDGFYYDFEFPEGVTVNEDDFPQLEQAMRKHIKAKERFEREEITTEAALERFREQRQDYKVELIEDLITNTGVQSVSLYTNGPFTDLCRGPHAPTTSSIRAFKLQSVAGAYWRGDADRKMLTRIYGTAFFSKDELKEHLALLEQARARDHRKLGKELELFMFSELSPGSPFWKPNGMELFNQLTRVWRAENARRGYREVRTPILYDAELWKRSGHWDKYRENMYFTEVESRVMGLKPMNCPAHIQLYNSRRQSYRDLPIRYSEAGLVHRHEPSGTLHGLMRVRHITQDDAHIFCTEQQVQQEVVDCLDFAFSIYKLFDFKPRLELSTRPKQRIGDDAMWDRAEQALAGALDSQGLEYEVNEGDGAFYGPKIDLHMTDSLKRSWQLGTVQLDYSMPERFDLHYIGADNAEHVPVMIHRAMLGSFERFIGILIEHYGGVFPLWLAPLQVQLVAVADRHVEFAAEIQRKMVASGLRVQLDDRSESVSRKIRDAQLAKAPLTVVIGDKELDSDLLTVREYGSDQQEQITLTQLIERIDSQDPVRQLEGQ